MAAGERRGLRRLPVGGAPGATRAEEGTAETSRLQAPQQEYDVIVHVLSFEGFLDPIRKSLPRGLGRGQNSTREQQTLEVGRGRRGPRWIRCPRIGHAAGPVRVQGPAEEEVW